MSPNTYVTLADEQASAREIVGVRWKEVTQEKASTAGRKVNNRALARALQHKLEFTKEELDVFHLSQVPVYSYMTFACTT